MVQTVLFIKQNVIIGRLAFIHSCRHECRVNKKLAISAQNSFTALDLSPISITLYSSPQPLIEGSDRFKLFG